MSSEDTQFKPGNKAAEKWTELEATKAFQEMLDFTANNKSVLSVQQAYIDFGIPAASYYYLQDKFPVLEPIKKGIKDIIISRVNKGALEGDYNPTAGIWRMKQLGEKDTQHQEVKGTIKQTNINPIDWVD